jgi:hypothetical protein
LEGSAWETHERASGSAGVMTLPPTTRGEFTRGTENP